MVSCRPGHQDQMLAVYVPAKQQMHLLEMEEMLVEFSEAADRDAVSTLLRQSLWTDAMRDNSVLTLILSVTRLREVLWGQTSDSCGKKAGHCEPCLCRQTQEF